MDVREIAGRELTISPHRDSALQNSQQALLLGGSQVHFLVSGYICGSMRLRNISWRSPLEDLTQYFFSLHPMACADDSRRNIHT